VHSIDDLVTPAVIGDLGIVLVGEFAAGCVLNGHLGPSLELPWMVAPPPMLVVADGGPKT
jgi:hypothetical protein